MDSLRLIPVDTLCRCCLNEKSQLTNLCDKFVDDELILDPDITNSDAIFMCTSVRYDEDNANIESVDDANELPKTICDVCLMELRIAVNFRVKCEASERLLQQQRQHIIASKPSPVEDIWVEEIVENEQIEVGTILAQVDDVIKE